MGLFSSFKYGRVAKTAQALVEKNKADEALATIRTAINREGAAPAMHFAKRMVQIEEYEIAHKAICLAANTGSSDKKLRLLEADILWKLDKPQEARAVLEHVFEHHPATLETCRPLARLYLSEDALDDVVRVLEPVRNFGDEWVERRLAETYFELGRNEDAIELLEHIVSILENRLGNTFDRDESEQVTEVRNGYIRMMEEAVAELHGSEAVVMQAADMGNLDANAGVNYLLIGDRLMIESETVVKHLHLRDINSMENEGERIGDHNKKNFDGLLLRGTVALRTGMFEKAQDIFKKAVSSDGNSFAAYRGLGASMEAQRYAFEKHVNRIPDFELPDNANRVVKDYANLGELERRVVDASVYPLAPALDRLIEKGVVIRVLPIDVRAVDLPEYAERSGERTEDNRTMDAATGLASYKLAITKVEDLLDVSGPNGLVFAHEFAHLVYFHFREELSEQLFALMDEADEAGYVCSGYQMKNPDEFFAVGYVNYLRAKLDLPNDLVEDDEGVLDNINAYFEGVRELVGER